MAGLLLSSTAIILTLSLLVKKSHSLVYEQIFICPSETVHKNNTSVFHIYIHYLFAFKLRLHLQH